MLDEKDQEALNKIPPCALECELAEVSQNFLKLTDLLLTIHYTGSVKSVQTLL